MLNTEVLPSFTGLAYDDDGAPWLVYSDGTRLRPIAGGDGSDEGDADDSKSGDDDQDDGDADDSKSGDDDQDDGDDKTDWRAEAEKWKKLSRKNERAAKAARREADEAKQKKAPPKKKTDTEPDDETSDPEQIREEARKEAQRDALRDRALDRVEAKAGKLFKDPEDARLHLAKSVEDFIDGDEIDTDAITEALEQLLTDKPHLAASKKRFNGDGDGGARKDKPKKATSLTEAVERRMTGKT
jgi:hypothetical protein